MNPRLRKLIGLFAILGFLLFYVGVMVRLARYVPDHGPLQFAFYALAGTCWGLPLLPLISWMNRGSPPPGADG
ncbi:MAG TPA: DUF2842 domain-containing protein [Phenylobacterium sp.]|jgi:hypothetical protein|uniref:DUF2842 domain-containing protein n=1 Tax=Phenylobacterium sp. TaxID=1871053 RepID=UPI002D5F6ACF|nr:DUF2842 domain-containing protein [Phenylobacterium sp.]HZZ70202.1 DUF2842 domain-containing protein [Phenylobacterium sp.]